MTRRTYVLPMLGLLVPSIASATGICEDTGTTYGTPTQFAEATNTFAVPATLTWCEETQDGGTIDELRGTIAYTELRDVNDDVVAVLSEAQGQDLVRLQSKVSNVEEVPTGKLGAELARRGYVALVAKSPSKAACRVRATWKKAPKGEKVDGFPAERMFFEVRAGKKSVQTKEIGLSAKERHAAGVVVAHFYTTKKAVALLTLLPTCAGPPPGYFGPDDGGSCYNVDTIKASMIDGSKGALARCF
ncbi:MAG: hypothetical protein SFX73_30815 [Kofleriaceae bacterium]|nr:hypothetical protein [Kofleriaceae bacterium]